MYVAQNCRRSSAVRHLRRTTRPPLQRVEKTQTTVATCLGSVHQDVEQGFHERLVLSQPLRMTTTIRTHHRDLGNLLHELHDRVDVVVVAALRVAQETVLQLLELLQRQLANVDVVDLQQPLQEAQNVRLRSLSPQTPTQRSSSERNSMRYSQQSAARNRS